MDCPKSTNCLSTIERMNREGRKREAAVVEAVEEFDTVAGTPRWQFFTSQERRLCTMDVHGCVEPGEPRKGADVVGIVVREQHSIDITEFESGIVDTTFDRLLVGRPAGIHERKLTSIDDEHVRLVKRLAVDTPNPLTDLFHDDTERTRNYIGFSPVAAGCFCGVEPICESVFGFDRCAWFSLASRRSRVVESKQI